MRALLSALATLALLAGAVSVRAEELPPAPAAHFNDYAGLVPVDEARRLDDKLREFDEKTSTQIVVAVFPKLLSPSLEDFTVRTAEAWKAGNKEYDNGAVLFVFVEDRKLRIEVGYGLEGALPDALCRRILDDEVVPRFRAGDWTGGLEAGIDAILAATRGEYRPPQRKDGVPIAAIVIIVVFVFLFFWLASQGSRGVNVGRTYDRRGWRGGGSWGGGWSGGGGSRGGGGGGWSGGGGFSGGGGSFGGGGASSSW